MVDHKEILKSQIAIVQAVLGIWLFLCIFLIFILYDLILYRQTDTDINLIRVLFVLLAIELYTSFMLTNRLWFLKAKLRIYHDSIGDEERPIYHMALSTNISTNSENEGYSTSPCSHCATISFGDGGHGHVPLLPSDKPLPSYNEVLVMISESERELGRSNISGNQADQLQPDGSPVAVADEEMGGQPPPSYQDAVKNCKLEGKT